MNEEEIVLKRLKDTLAVLTGKNVITNLDFQIRNMVEDCIKVIEKQQAEIEDCKKCVLRDEVHNYIEELEKKDKIIDEMAEEIASYNRYEAGALEEKEEVIKFFTNKATDMNVGE